MTISRKPQSSAKPEPARGTTVWLVLCLIGAVLLLFQRDHLREYRLYFTEDRPALNLRFDEFSASWTESSLRARFAGMKLRCEAYADSLPADRVCALDAASINDIPVLFVSFFFSSGGLRYVSVNVPWWAHHTAYEQLVAMLGRPVVSQARANAGVRLHAWRTRGGALFFNRDVPFNPLEWNAILWTEAATCAETNCLRSN